MADFGLVKTLAGALGTNEASLTLILGLLAGYPLAYFQRQFLFGQSATLHHIYFSLTGLAILYANFGTDILHHVVCVFTNYLLMRTIGPKLLSVQLAFLFNMGYLLAGYHFCASNTYDVMWTTPHCVMTLRLIGLVTDYYDGGKDPAQQSADQKKLGLTSLPSLLAVAGHSFHFGGVLVGPQFPMRMYLDMIEGKLTDNTEGKRPACVVPALKRMALGLGYTVVFAILNGYYYDDYMTEPAFFESSWLQKYIFVLIWGKVMLYKYVGCWLLAEGSCILSSLTYNGRDEQGNPLWDSCKNIKLSKFEMVMSFQDVIDSFNINTNKWAAHYVYKRLKFLNNRMMSQLSTLVFLALWHGFHSGYYACFFLELVYVNAEKQAHDLMKVSPMVSSVVRHPVIRPVLLVSLKLVLLAHLGYPLVPFALLKSAKWWQVHQSLYFTGHWPFLVFLAAAPFLKKVLKPRTSGREGTKTSKETKSD
ncbi:lysophospholipid acyltransferase 5-like [Branchiostoma floridae x Branchiostoma belcheri]